ncbi:MAG TPA: TlpA disulfide reductase family protein [Caldimonas sp.]|nr:TlpA disulfide reductase family protein [Caldimonas sp.]
MALLAIAASGSAVAAPKAGDAAPEFAGQTSDGETVSLSAYAGKVVVVSFWATWCVPCQKELPILEGIQQTAGKGRVQVVAINIESGDAFRSIARRATSLHMLIASDAGETAQRAYGVNGIPHLVIIGKTGRIIRIHRGYSEAAVDDVIADLNRALAQ